MGSLFEPRNYHQCSYTKNTDEKATCKCKELVCSLSFTSRLRYCTSSRSDYVLNIWDSLTTTSFYYELYDLPNLHPKYIMMSKTQFLQKVIWFYWVGNLIKWSNIETIHLQHINRNIYLNTLRPRQNGLYFADDILSACSWMKTLGF